MNELQIHLFFNHVPVIGASVALLVVIIGFVLKNSAVRATGLAVYIAMSLAVIPTYLTGEGAEERIENIAGISEDVIESHEDMAKVSLWFMLGAAAIAAASLYTQWKQHSRASLLSIIFLVVAIGAFVQIGLTAHEGGKIRRPDLNSPSATQPAAADKD
ncbi:MAG: hypothetical protein NTX15_08820 [Candidatus Kapabacteria bacterium]|nr:hypothetical protein [Candidatus Kapabacteria bacterium]